MRIAGSSVVAAPRVVDGIAGVGGKTAIARMASAMITKTMSLSNTI
jgi:hypothetical protein